MPRREHPVRLRRPDGVEVDGRIVTDPGGWLWLIGPGIKTLGRGHDFFTALMDARKEFEAEGWRVLVWGASRNVWRFPKRHTLHRLQPGKAANPFAATLVGIFDAGPDMDPCTVEEQTESYERWCETIR